MGFLCQHVWVHVLFNVGEFWRSMITVLAKWEPPCLLWGRNRSGGPLQNTSCVLPFRPAIKQLFNFAPSKICLVTLCGCRQRVTRPTVGETTRTIQNSRKCQTTTQDITTVFELDSPTSGKPFRQCRYHGFSVPAVWAHVLFNVGEFWRSMITVLSKWEPLCFLWGRSCSGCPLQNTSCVLPFRPAKNSCSILLPAKFVWLLFAAAGKESLARQWAKPQEQFKIAVNAKHQYNNKSLASGARPAMSKWITNTLIINDAIKKASINEAFY